LKEEENGQVYDEYDNFIRMISDKLREINLMIQTDKIQQQKVKVKEFLIRN
jgi:hypothetical protein